MDEKSLYREATLVERPSVASIADIYAEATSIKVESTGGSDEYFETSGAKNQLGSSNQVDNIFIFLMSGSTLTIPRGTIMSGFDADNDNNWSVSIPISNLAYSGGTIAYDDNTALNVGTGATGSSAQTIARIPIIRNQGLVSSFGSYKENIICKSGSPIVEYYKI